MLRWLIGGLAVAIVGLWKLQQSFYKKMDDERTEAYKRSDLERTVATEKLLKRHTEDGIELKGEIKTMQLERKEERKEWLQALDKNTNKVETVAEQLATVATLLQVIPNLQCDLDNMKIDIVDIKNKLNGATV